MAPKDLLFFSATTSKTWVVSDEAWFTRLAAADSLNVAERVHIARVAIQQQMICDVRDTSANREAITNLGLSIVASNEGFLIVSGSMAMQEYLDFRGGSLGTVEAGLFYGYASTAINAFTDLIAQSSPQPAPTTTAEFFLGGAYSHDQVERERIFIAGQWRELEAAAPEICRLAEDEFVRRSTSAAA